VLRNRREDIPILFEHIITRFNGLQGKNITGVSPEVLAVLMEHDYPGNVRELQNIIEHAFVLCHRGLIEGHHLPPALRALLPHAAADQPGATNLASVERALIAETLRQHSGSRTRAARALGVNPSTLYRKIRVMKIDVPETDGRGRRQQHQTRK
jgi:DNA-binding NtrC family response regulator